MKKSLSIKTGGRKLSATSSSKNVSLNKKGAGVVKATKGGTNQKMGIYGVAQTGPTGPNDSGIATMKKGGSTKMHPITSFRKANEARQGVVKSSMKKMQIGGQEEPRDSRSFPKPIGVNASLGNFSGGFKGDVTGNKISNSAFNASYENPKTGFGVNANYTPENKKIRAGVNYNTTIGKNKTPLKLGVTYNKNGGATKALPKAQYGKTIGKVAKTSKPIPKTVTNRNRPTSNKPIPTRTSAPTSKKAPEAIFKLVTKPGVPSKAPKKSAVKKPVAPKKTVSGKIIDSSVPMTGPDRPMQKPMMAKKGGAVNKMQTGGTSSTKTNMFGKTKNVSKKKAENIGTRFASKKNHTFEDVGDGVSYTIKPKAKSKRSVTTGFKKGGVVKTKKK
jgi:hypothetical protein